MNKPIRLVAIDLDGTLFQKDSTIADADRQAVRDAIAAGTVIAISTGRPLSGLPFQEIEDLGIRYAITTNGAAIYEFPSRRPVYNRPVPNADILPVVEMLQTMDVYFDIFIDGDGFGYGPKLDVIDKTVMTPALRSYIRNTRTQLSDTAAYLKETGADVQKITIDIYSDEAGHRVDADRIAAWLDNHPMFRHLSGGYGNMEITLASVTKGAALKVLADRLGISMEETMAIGDTENDLDIIQTAGLGVAMANGEQCVLETADYVTASFDSFGVSQALKKFVFMSTPKLQN